MKHHSAKGAVAASIPGVIDHSHLSAPRYSEDITGVDRWKRSCDVVVSVVALLILSPVVFVAALAVKITSSGPVFFSQERIGLNRRLDDRRNAYRSDREADRRGTDRRAEVKFGRPFKMFKFRTMVTDAEKGTPKFSRIGDPRITSVGRFLRKTRIDEVPQFVNVLKGEMSIVGPRPERAYFIGEAQKEIPDFQRRLRTKPGITGLAQVSLGYTNTIKGLDDKLLYDLRYIDRVSPSTDLKIMARTISVVLTGKGAC